jgi:hypothetical protein
MGWRLDLSDQAVRAVELVEGEPPQLAVWTPSHEVRFYDIQDGTVLDALDVFWPNATNFGSEAWRAFLERLRAPNGMYLPVVDVGGVTVHTSNDGRLRLYEDSEHRLMLDVDGQRTILQHPGEAAAVAVALDRELGTLGVLAQDGLFHLYQQHVHMGTMPVALDLDEKPTVFVPDMASIVWLVDRHHVLGVDNAGQVAHHLDLAEAGIRAAACSADGLHIAITDQSGMIRLYDAQLRLQRQQDVHSLLEATRPLQPRSLPTDSGWVADSISISNAGHLAFVAGGILCVTAWDQMRLVPQARRLI